MENVRYEKLNLSGIPALVYGTKSDKVYVAVHGKKGNKEEAQFLAQTACEKGYQVLSFDLPGHGSRTQKKEPLDPWHAVPDIKTVMTYAHTRWNSVSVCATSIGAWFSMLALAQDKPEKYLFVSPLVDMEEVITGMMQKAQVTEPELTRWKNVPTSDGNTISLEYLRFARENPVSVGSVPCSIIYGENDNITGREKIEEFTRREGCELTVVSEAEHWFHTPAQLDALREWLGKNV